jgi:hypothetical protein
VAPEAAVNLTLENNYDEIHSLHASVRLFKYCFKKGNYLSASEAYRAIRLSATKDKRGSEDDVMPIFISLGCPPCDLREQPRLT